MGRSEVTFGRLSSVTFPPALSVGLGKALKEETMARLKCQPSQVIDLMQKMSPVNSGTRKTWYIFLELGGVHAT